MLKKLKTKFKNLKVKSKILVSIMLITLTFGIILSTVTLGSLYSVRQHNKASTESLADELSAKSSSILKEQTFKHIDQVSKKQTEKFNMIFSKVQQSTAGVALGIKDIYDNKTNFKGIEIVEPSKAPKGDLDDLYSASSKMYSTEEITPAIKSEMNILSNAEFVAKPLYINSYDIDSIYIVTESGLCYNYSVFNDLEKIDLRNRSWYKDAVNAFYSGNEEPVWQSTYVDSTTKKECISCSKAFADKNGKLLGVVCIDTFIDTIVSDINENDMKSLGYIFLKDKQNKTIAASSNLSESDYNTFNDVLNKDTTLQKELNINENNYITSSNLIDSTGWNLFVLKSQDEILKIVKHLDSQIDAAQKSRTLYMKSLLWRLILIFLLIFFILAILSIYVSKFTAKKITDPLSKLAEEADAIGKGAFKRKIKIDSNDEIGDLANSFNKMARDLVTYMRNFKKITKEKERISSELMIARKIQKSMLPCIFPPFPSRKDVDIFASINPARLVGGDFYDFFFIDDEHIAIVIGDVSGKGIAAALFMVIARTLIKNQAQNGFLPDEIFRLVNNQLSENNEAGMFVTAFMGILNLKTGEFIYSNAGHNKPLIFKTKTGFKWIDTKPGFVLGGMENMKYKLDKMQLDPKDMLYLYTDGVTEAHDINNNLFSDEKLITTLNIPEVKNSDIKSIILKIDQEIKSFTKGAEQSDDITMLMLKYFGNNNNKDSDNNSKN